jgi:uncharacterized membrane protein
MSGSEGWLSGPLGPVFAISVMTAATYGCRISGVILMKYVRLTPAVKRALAALPGSIVAATVAPTAIWSGPAAMAGILTAVLTMIFTRQEAIALIAGLAAAAATRLLGV